MAWVVTRSSIGRLLNVVYNKTGAHTASAKAIVHPGVSVQVAKISGCALRDKTRKRPPPFPYKEKDYNFFRAIFDKTTYRFDENSKLVVVEGPIASGKSTFAKSLADDLDMLYLPEVNMDLMYIDSYGTDLRCYDSELPESCRTFDIKNFYTTPDHQNVAVFQINMFMLRYSQYIDALAHIMNTGQGVVLERCAYSDFVFMEAMHKCGFLSKGARSVYYDIQKNCMSDLLRPHLVIYLDIPVKKVQERIKERNIPSEVNSKVLNSEYLGHLDYFYKQRYLKEISSHAELLIYDWSNYGDVEVVVEDIERIDFEQYGKLDAKLRDWRMGTEWDWNEARIMYSSQKHKLMCNFNVPRYDVPELVISAEDLKKRMAVMDKIPGKQYAPGYNADMGDTGLLFKLKLEKGK